jgi:sec-independent protein translocase protein TatA
VHLGIGETLILLLVALLVFGPSKLPQLGDALGKGLRNFKRGLNHEDPPAAETHAQLPATAPPGAAPTSGAASPEREKTVL